MKKKVEKAYEITDAKISFVSLVDKAANKKQFLLTKAENGKANFTTYGRILKVDLDHHYVTGIVYEPNVEDAHGNYMTEEEIIKAAYYFAKNGDSVDLQHSFDALEDATVVENWVTKSDMTIEEEEIIKGTWLITVEITDSEVWEQIEKGEITGFSMGGVGKYSDEDVELENVEKGAGKVVNEPIEKTSENKSILKKFAEMLGFDVVEKGAFNDEFNKRKKANNFWSAFYTLENLLATYSWYEDGYKFESDEATITESLQEFSAVITDILTMDGISKALASSEKLVEKADKNKEEEDEVKKDDVQKMIDDAVKKASEINTGDNGGEEVKKEDLTLEKVADMIEEAVKKALEPNNGEVASVEPIKKEALTAELVAEMIAKAVEPIKKARNLPSNLNDVHDGEGEIQKSNVPNYMSHFSAE